MVEGLLALRGQPPAVDTTTAESVALDLYGLTARATPLEGERDRNFRLDTSDGRRLVLKFIDPEADEVVVDGQSAALAHIAATAPLLSVPRVVGTRGGELVGVVPLAGGGAAAGGGVGRGGQGSAAVSCRVRLVSFVPGRLMQEVRSPAPAGLLRSVGTRIAHLDRALVGFFHPALAQPIAWDVRRAHALLPMLAHVQPPKLQRTLRAALDPLEQLLQRMRGLRSQAIHGDCHGRNLLVNNAGDACVGIIDLGDMIHAPLALEIAVTMAELLTDGNASLDEFPELLTGYTSLQPLERADVEVLYDLITARVALGVLIQVWRERDGAQTGSDLATASEAVLEELASRGKEDLTQQWLDATGIQSVRMGRRRVVPADLVRRRHNALGANAELSYDQPLHLVRGEGVWVFTSDAERLLDVYNNVPHVGHAHPAVVAAIANQAKRIASNTRYLDTRIIEYVERLTETLPPDLDACLFVNSGSEANDIAWRMAKSHTGHEGALVMTFAYHGITDAVTALSPAICARVPPYVEQIAAPKMAPNDNAAASTTGAAIAATSTTSTATAPLAGADIANVIAATAEADVTNAIARLNSRGFQPAALMIDSALTSTGIYDPPPAWIAPIAAAVRKAGGLIIGDEVQFGLGRSGSHFWGFTRRGYHPDIVTLGKPVGNGYPLGVVITRRALLEKFQRDTGFFSTFGGNPVAAAAGLAVLDVLDKERLVENARTTGDYFARRLKELAQTQPAIREVRGCGLMIGVELTDRATTKYVVNGLRERGVLTGSEGPLGNVLKLRPPMPFRMEHVEIVVEALNATLSASRP
ncbi:MAG: aminotransferase class III-fold pyridoxal phosphate-dependent enzyme [Proteobacteria bacterium]|nr:aminotransferase class III-fold pyridoxal phosphate-dependent enzyme [Pseudomonadota bacterium]